MKKLIIASAAAVLLGAPLASAANTTTTTTTTPTTTTKPATQHSSLMQECHALGVQFDKAEPKHKTDKNFNDAMALRKEGRSLCVGHKESDGIKKIEDALTMIGVKPAVKS